MNIYPIAAALKLFADQDDFRITANVRLLESFTFQGDFPAFPLKWNVYRAIILHQSNSLKLKLLKLQGLTRLNIYDQVRQLKKQI